MATVYGSVALPFPLVLCTTTQELSKVATHEPLVEMFTVELPPVLEIFVVPGEIAVGGGGPPSPGSCTKLPNPTHGEANPSAFSPSAQI